MLFVAFDSLIDQPNSIRVILIKSGHDAIFARQLLLKLPQELGCNFCPFFVIEIKYTSFKGKHQQKRRLRLSSQYHGSSLFAEPLLLPHNSATEVVVPLAFQYKRQYPIDQNLYIPEN